MCLRVVALVGGLLAADGVLGLPEGGGPLPLQLAGLLGFLLPLGQDLDGQHDIRKIWW